MRLPLFIPVLFLLHYSSALSAQNNYAAYRINPAMLENAGVVVRTDETLIEMDDDGYFTQENRYIATLFSDAAEKYTVHPVLETEFQKVKSLVAKVYDADGNLVWESKKSDIMETTLNSQVEFTGHRTKYLSVTHNTYPYTVEFYSKITVKNFNFSENIVFQRVGESVESAKLILKTHPDFDYSWKAFNLTDPPEESSQGKLRVRTWHVKNLAAKPGEVFHPYFNGAFAGIMLAPKKIVIDDYSGEATDWKKVGRFFYDMNKDRDELSSEMQSTIRAMTADKTELRDKIAVLYRYLQQNCRYVSIQLGVGGWQTFPASMVEKKKYGDCKALSNYMKAMLKVIGIESWLALIYAGNEGAPVYYDDFPTLHFNHMILYVPAADCWLECTSNDTQPGYLGAFTSDRQVLLLTPEGGKLTRTPVFGTSENLTLARLDLQITETGGLKAYNRRTVFGVSHEAYQRLSREKNREELYKTFLESQRLPIARLESLDIHIDPNAPKAMVEFSYLSDNYAAKSGKRMFVPILKIRPFPESLPADDHRMLDLKTRDAYTWIDSVSLALPPGYSVEHLPGNKEIKSEFGAYRLQVNKMEGTVHIVRTVEILPVNVPAARYGEVRQFYLDAAKIDGSQMVLVKKE